MVTKKRAAAVAGASAAAAAVSEAYAEDATGTIETTLIEQAAKKGLIDAAERDHLLSQATK